MPGTSLFAGLNIDAATARALSEVAGLGLLPAGALGETFPRASTPLAAATIVNGQATYTAIELTRGTIVTNINFWSHSTAASAPTHEQAALLDANFNRLAQSADLTSAAWAANSLKAFAMATPYVVPADGVYYVGLAVTATTPPTLAGLTGVVLPLVDVAPPVGFTDTANAITTTFPAKATNSAGLTPLYAYVS